MKIYLLNPPFIQNYVRSSRCTWIPIAGSNWYPIFLAYAAGYLEKNGHQVKLKDALVEGLTHEETIKDIVDFQPKIVVIYISLDSLENEIDLAKKIKNKFNPLIVFVGPWCAMDSVDLLKKGEAADVVIKREFDKPLLNLANNKILKEIKGVVYRENSEIKDTDLSAQIFEPSQVFAGQKFMADKQNRFNSAKSVSPKIWADEGEFLTSQELDELPYVTDIYRRYLDIYKYKQTSLKYPFIDLFTARGCAWGKCTFCLWPNTIHKGIPFRMRSIPNVVEEIKFIKRELPYIKEIFFQDDMLPRGRIRELSQAILDSNLKIVWSGYAKADIDLETLKLAKKSGCRFLHVGYETSDKQILDNVNKGDEPKIMEEFTKNAQKAGVKIHGDFIFGLPGETKETILKTINWAKKLGISDYQFVVPQPHLSTPFYQWLKANNCLNDEGKIDYPHLSLDELEYWRFYAYRKIYLSPQYIWGRFRDSLKNPSEFIRLIKVAFRGLPKIFRFKK